MFVTMKRCGKKLKWLGSRRGMTDNGNSSIDMNGQKGTTIHKGMDSAGRKRVRAVEELMFLEMIRSP